MRMAALNFGICDKEFIPSIYQVTIETETGTGTEI